MSLGVQVVFQDGSVLQDISQFPRKLRAVLDVLCLWLPRYSLYYLNVSAQADPEYFSIPRWNLRGKDDEIINWFINTLGVEVVPDPVLGQYHFRSL